MEETVHVMKLCATVMESTRQLRRLLDDDMDVETETPLGLAGIFSGRLPSSFTESEVAEVERAILSRDSWNDFLLRLNSRKPRPLVPTECPMHSFDRYLVCKWAHVTRCLLEHKRAGF